MDKAPREFKRHGSPEKKGLILVYTGDGKGKTTAALGTALRAAGTGLSVIMIQFIKGNWRSGEIEAAKSLSGRLEIIPMGEGFTWDTKNYEKDVECASRTWQKCLEILSDDEHGLIIFDEINYALQYEFLKTAEVVQALKNKPPLKHVILTGRNAPPEIIKIADLVTDMKPVKHPYAQGIQAQRGIDY